MSTLNNIIEYGQITTLKLEKTIRYISSYMTKYFSKIDYNNLYIYIIIFFIYISITLKKLSNSTNAESLNNIKNTSYSYLTLIIIVCYIITFIFTKYGSDSSVSFIHAIIMLYIIFTYFNTLFNDKNDVSGDDYEGWLRIVSFGYVKKQEDMIHLFNYIITILFVIGFLSLFKSMSGNVPDVYFIGIMILSIPLYIISPIGRDNIVNIFNDKLYYIFILLILSSMILNISKYRTRTINVMNIILISSIILISIFSTQIINDPNISNIPLLSDIISINKEQLINSKNYESIRYIYNSSNASSLDCDYYENKNGSLINICKNNNKSFNIRENKISNFNNGFSELHSFTGPVFIFILLQIILAVLCFGSIKLFLNKYPNPPKLYTKFIIYIIIINITVFYFNILVKQYNIFGLRNILYGNSESCLVIDKNSSDIDNYYGDYTDTLSNRYTCINKTLSDKYKTTTWKDLFIYFYDTNDDKLNKDIIVNGAYITIYSLFIFMIMYLCDYLSYWKEIPSLKFVCLLISLVIIIVYIIVRNIKSDIDTIKNNKFNPNKPEEQNIYDTDS